MAAEFIPGLALTGAFYAEVVGPLLSELRPGLVYAAARLGPGSDVLGLDTARSMDHDWGPRLQVLLADGAGARELREELGAGLPREFAGHRVFFPDAKDPAAGPRHWVEVAELGHWLTGLLGFDPSQGVGLADWLATSTQLLAEVTAGAVYYDGWGALTEVRQGLAWYPDEVWRYVLACQWHRISQEEAFPGRCAEVGDELGSAVVTARLAREVMRLCLLMSRRYPPYSKWLGSAFAALPDGAIGAELLAAVQAGDWATRQEHLGRALELAAERQNELGLTAALSPATRQFYDRPFQVLDADRFALALRATLADPRLRDRPFTGAVDQFIDSTDALGSAGLRRAAVAAAG
jgi:hypothetical protein